MKTAGTKSVTLEVRLIVTVTLPNHVPDDLFISEGARIAADGMVSGAAAIIARLRP